MKKAVCRFLLVSTLLVTACSGETMRFEDFSSETGQFTVSIPGEVEETQQSVETPVGPIDIHTYTTEKQNSAYVVAYSDYPPEIVAASDPQELLDSSRDGAISNLKGTIISEDVIELAGNPGRALVIDATNEQGEEATINSRIYLVDNRLYQLLVVLPKGQEDTTNVDTFLESFTLQ